MQQIGGHVGIDRCGLKSLVTQQDLNDADVDLALKQVRREAVAPMSLKR